ncbi:MAG: transketolase [Ruminococcaceae bacterium]|nr:transketolase [Oscillospiraceae bacterium]
MENSKKLSLRKVAEEIRLGILEGTYNAGSGHPGGSLSCADVMAYLYFEELNIDPANPKWEDRDRFVLSKGHAAPALYAALSLRGFFPREDIKTLRQIDSHLQGHPDMNKTPGVDISTGSLGIGVSNACGMALAAKLQNKDFRVYAITGDGELQEGQIWESAMFASHYKLDNLIVFADINGLQIDGKTSDVMSVEPVDKRFEAFGWNVTRIDGHDFDAIEAAVQAAKQVKGKPSVIVCDTVKGKGVSFMENKAGWHGVAPKKDEYEAAVAEVSARLQAIEQEG